MKQLGRGVDCLLPPLILLGAYTGDEMVVAKNNNTKTEKSRARVDGSQRRLLWEDDCVSWASRRARCKSCWIIVRTGEQWLQNDSKVLKA